MSVCAEPPTAEVDADRLRLSGAWTLAGFAAGLPEPPADLPVLFDASALSALDSAGALLLLEFEAAAPSPVRWQGLSPRTADLLELVRQRRTPAVGEGAAAAGCLAQLGRAAHYHWCELRDVLAFFGELTVVYARLWLRPQRFRWRPFASNLQSAGLDALPIVGLLSFLLGFVIAYQGGAQLGRYGAGIFIVELVGLTMLREMAVMMTAIIVAGRTGSAWTAQLGTMQVTQEVDALRTLGIDPYEMLVIPKLAALMVALPLLTVFADVMGVLGGMVMAQLQLGVGFSEFLQRFPQAVSLRSFLIGVGKAPVFALLIALVGCYQGLRVRGGAEAVGRQTTVSVVQAIFMVIVVDAAFSVLFSWLKI